MMASTAESFRSYVDSAPSKITNPNIFKLEQKKKHVLCHEIGAGSKCTKCDCPGLELHFWRKICKVCSCRMDEHDVHMPDEYDHAQIVIGRLFGVHDIFENLTLSEMLHNNNHSTTTSSSNSPNSGLYAKINKPVISTRDNNSASFSKSVPQSRYNFRLERGPEQNKTITEYAWAPVDDSRLVEKYMEALPEEERPVIGTQGEQLRRQRLAFQLPLYDTSVEASHVERTERDKQLHGEFVHTAIQQAGVGKVVEVTASTTNTERRVFVDSDTQTDEKKERKERREEEDRSLSSLSSVSSKRNVVKCQSCSEEICQGDVGIRTDHSMANELWHPGCFRCAKCAQLLVDMLYFYHEGNYFCGRHFADEQYPRCSGCDELIFANEYTWAEEKAWHYDHFCCFQCDIQLGGCRYMMKSDNPYCIDCYMKHFARTCDSCQQKIGPDQKRLNYQELHWHADSECFHCKQCGLDLINKKFILKEHCLFCSSKCRANYFESIN